MNGLETDHSMTSDEARHNTVTRCPYCKTPILSRNLESHAALCGKNHHRNKSANAILRSYKRREESQRALSRSQNREDLRDEENGYAPTNGEDLADECNGSDTMDVESSNIQALRLYFRRSKGNSLSVDEPRKLTQVAGNETSVAAVDETAVTAVGALVSREDADKHSNETYKGKNNSRVRRSTSPRTANEGIHMRHEQLLLLEYENRKKLKERRDRKRLTASQRNASAKSRSESRGAREHRQTADIGSPGTRSRMSRRSQSQTWSNHDQSVTDVHQEDMALLPNYVNRDFHRSPSDSEKRSTRRENDVFQVSCAKITASSPRRPTSVSELPQHRRELERDRLMTASLSRSTPSSPRRRERSSQCDTQCVTASQDGTEEEDEDASPQLHRRVSARVEGTGYDDSDDDKTELANQVVYDMTTPNRSDRGSASYRQQLFTPSPSVGKVLPPTEQYSSTRYETASPERRRVAALMTAHRTNRQMVAPSISDHNWVLAALALDNERRQSPERIPNNEENGRFATGGKKVVPPSPTSVVAQSAVEEEERKYRRDKDTHDPQRCPSLQGEWCVFKNTCPPVKLDTSRRTVREEFISSDVAEAPVLKPKVASSVSLHQHTTTVHESHSRNTADRNGTAPPPSRFCVSCGSQLPSVNVGKQVLFCPHCGEKL